MVDSTRVQEYDIIIKGVAGFIATIFGDVSMSEADEFTRMAVQVIIGVTTIVTFFKTHKKNKQLKDKNNAV